MKARYYCESQGNLFSEVPPDSAHTKTPVAIALAAMTQPKTRNYLWPEAFHYPATLEERVRASTLALETLESLDALTPTEDQRDALSRFSGWGGLAPVVSGREQWRHKAYGEALMKALGEDRVMAAEQSALTSYFTPPEVVRGIWEGLRHLGFAGGNVLDPAAGTGAFIGMCPPDLIDRCKFTLIEKDQITGDIARALYPDSRTHVAGLEEVRLPENHYDLVIGNVPFGNFSVADGEMRTFRGPIHDYFLLKALRKCREGGLIALLTTSGTLDKQSGRLRNELASNARLMGAIRLPQSTFAYCGAHVTVDLVVLQKLPTHMCDADSADWTKAVAGASGTFVNNYFLHNPDAVLGDLEVERSQYSNYKTVCNGPQVTRTQILQRFVRMPRVAAIAAKRIVGIDLMADESAPEGSIQLHEGVPNVVRNGMLMRIEINGRRAKRLIGLVNVREAAMALIHSQVDIDVSEADVELTRQGLNRNYDEFVKEFGFLSSQPNQSAFDEDPSYPLLLSLEVVDETTDARLKAQIFAERTAWARRPRAVAENLHDAALIALDQTGTVDLDSVAGLMGLDREAVFTALQTEPDYFLDPLSQQVLPRDSYLSGDVREKLHQAWAAFDVDPRFERNIPALEAVQPKDLAPDQITARLGQNWIPKGDVEAFIEHVTNRSVRVTHVPEAALFQLQDTRHHSSVGADWQTTRMSFYALLEKGLNQQSPDVYDNLPPPKEGRVLNQDETIAARERLEYIQEQFGIWLWSDEERSKRLAALYNRIYNCYVDRVFNGEHLTFPGMSDVYRPRSNQRNAVWRSLQTGNMMLAHFVGSGKSLTLAAITMEKKRLGQWTKPMIAVQNSTLLQFTAEFLRVYPQARVLMMGRDDMTKEARKRFVAKIATSNWDAIIVPHSVFDRIAVYPETLANYLESQTAPLEAARDDSDDYAERRLVTQQIESLKSKIKNLTNEANKDDTIYFEELGVDGLAVDEAQAYKNAWHPTKMVNVAGINASYSQRAMSMRLKVMTIFQRQQGDRGVIFSTATPICNSMSEVFTIMQYLQPTLLVEKGLGCFDAWAAQFGQRVSSVEIMPEGSGFRVKERFSRFHNVPELARMVRQTWDVVLKGTVAEIRVPAIAGGKQTVVGMPRSEVQAAYIKGLVERADDVRKRRVKPTEDNMLKIVTEGRKAALDMRLLDPDIEDHTGSKVNECVRRVFEIWARSSTARSTQIVFCDTSTPNTTGFSVYHDIRRKLVDRGIPESEIAFIHDYDTDKHRFSLLQKFNLGSVRILLGSSEKLGIGTNAQSKLIALHHLDVPWRPDQVEQRDGRAIRQGNENAIVELLRYVTSGSFDAYMWSACERKAAFIEQFLAGTVDERSAEDLSDASLSYAEVKAIASGDPNVRDLCLVQMELRRLRIVARSKESVRNALRCEALTLPSRVAQLQERIRCLTLDIQMMDSQQSQQWTLPDGNTAVPEQAIGSVKAQINALPMRIMDPQSNYLLAKAWGFNLIMFVDDEYSSRRRGYALRGHGNYRLDISAHMDPAEMLARCCKRLAEVRALIWSDGKSLEALLARNRELTLLLHADEEKQEESRLTELERREEELLGLVQMEPA